jgi:HEPN domain-containing protein
LPRKTDSSNPADWLSFAESDLQGLRVLAERELSPELCSSKLAEVLEKILKAELIRLGWRLEKTHDLEKLANELQARGSDLATEVRPLAIALAEVYFAERYPGFDLEDPDWPAFREQLARVDALLRRVRPRVQTLGPSSEVPRIDTEGGSG